MSQYYEQYAPEQVIYGGFPGNVRTIESRMVFDGKRMRKPIVRKPIDFNAYIVKDVKYQTFLRSKYDPYYIPPHIVYNNMLLPSSSILDNPSIDITTKFAHASTNKVRCPINVVAWTPEGRRLITGASSGEFTLWNGMAFNFETIQQAHDSPVRAMVWTHNDNFMVTADNTGWIKYWQSNMNNLKAYQGHSECIRDISFARTDVKFASCADDGNLKIWDFETCKEDRVLSGHGGDVRCLDWHPHNSLIASGAKDYLLKLWDAKSGQNVATLYGHKNTIFRVKWNKNGNWILSGGRDQLIKLFDIRFMKDFYTFRGHKKEVTSLAWHPFHEKLFVSGGYDGALFFWIVGNTEAQGKIPNAHDGSVWDVAWHPLGHVLCSGSNDYTTKFWSRNKPGDKMRDKYNITQLPEDVRMEEENKQNETAQQKTQTTQESKLTIPGVIPGFAQMKAPEPVPVRQMLIPDRVQRTAPLLQQRGTPPNRLQQNGQPLNNTPQYNQQTNSYQQQLKDIPQPNFMQSYPPPPGMTVPPIPGMQRFPNSTLPGMNQQLPPGVPDRN